ncbi:MAG: AAA family ATPase [Clostridia bacterium]|nr:AAA family ATPase [Clostridia bacterium]
MSAFDKVIGYETIKTELIQICDMIHNRAEYEKLGAKLPQGVLLYGKPGLGKSLMVKCMIEESNMKAYTLRRSKGGSEFVEEIINIFRIARSSRKRHLPQRRTTMPH